MSVRVQSSGFHIRPGDFFARRSDQVLAPIRRGISLLILCYVVLPYPAFAFGTLRERHGDETPPTGHSDRMPFMANITPRTFIDDAGANSVTNGSTRVNVAGPVLPKCCSRFDWTNRLSASQTSHGSRRRETGVGYSNPKPGIADRARPELIVAPLETHRAMCWPSGGTENSGPPAQTTSLEQMFCAHSHIGADLRSFRPPFHG